MGKGFVSCNVLCNDKKYTLPFVEHDMLRAAEGGTK